MAEREYGRLHENKIRHTVAGQGTDLSRKFTEAILLNQNVVSFKPIEKQPIKSTYPEILKPSRLNRTRRNRDERHFTHICADALHTENIRLREQYRPKRRRASTLGLPYAAEISIW